LVGFLPRRRQQQPSVLAVHLELQADTVKSEQLLALAVGVGELLVIHRIKVLILWALESAEIQLT
jgi:hypothetical protein